MKKLLIIPLLILQLTCFAPGYLTLVIPAMEPIRKTYTLTEKLQAIITTESRNGVNNPNEIDAVGILQIYPIMVTEVNQILGYHKFQLSDRLSDSKSIQIFMVFQKKFNKTMDFEIMARLWAGGARGMKKSCTLKYYSRALKNLNS